MNEMIERTYLLKNIPQDIHHRWKILSILRSESMWEFAIIAIKDRIDKIEKMKREELETEVAKR